MLVQLTLREQVPYCLIDCSGFGHLSIRHIKQQKPELFLIPLVPKTGSFMK